MQRRHFMQAAGTAAASVIAPTYGLAQSEWPTREINFIVSTAPGGSADLSSRVILSAVGRRLKVPVVFRNVAGSLVLAPTQLAQARPDGYTIGLFSPSGVLLAPHLMQVPYSMASFDFLAGGSDNLYGLAVAAASPIKSVDDLVAAAKSRRVTVSSNTIINTVALLQLGASTGVKFHWVPTATQAEAVSQAAGGHTDATLQSSPELTPLVLGGQLRLLASAGEHRLPNFSEVKTLQELGYTAANRVPLGFAAPTGLDPAIRDRLETAIIAAVNDPETQSLLVQCGVIPNARTGQVFKALYAELAPVIEKAVADAGMKRR